MGIRTQIWTHKAYKISVLGKFHVNWDQNPIMPQLTMDPTCRQVIQQERKQHQNSSRRPWWNTIEIIIVFWIRNIKQLGWVWNAYRGPHTRLWHGTNSQLTMGCITREFQVRDHYRKLGFGIFLTMTNIVYDTNCLIETIPFSTIFINMSTLVTKTRQTTSIIIHTKTHHNFINSLAFYNCKYHSISW